MAYHFADKPAEVLQADNSMETFTNVRICPDLHSLFKGFSEIPVPRRRVPQTFGFGEGYNSKLWLFPPQCLHSARLQLCPRCPLADQ